MGLRGDSEDFLFFLRSASHLSKWSWKEVAFETNQVEQVAMAAAAEKKKTEEELK